MATALSGLCTPENLNQAFIDSEPWMHEQISDPTIRLQMPYWANMIDRAEFEMGKGYTHSKWQFHASPAPQTDALSLWHAMKQSTDTPESYEACNPPHHTVSYGFQKKSYSPYELILQTSDICLDDVVFQWEFEQQLNKIVASWRQITAMVWENWNRDNYHANTLILAAVDGFPTTGPASGNFGELPNVSGKSVGKLTQGILDILYERLVYQAGMYSMSMQGGNPVFGISTGMRDSHQLIKDDGGTREDFRYAKPDYLLQGYGEMLTYSRWMHMHDPFPPRYTIDSGGNWQRVWPHEAAATTIGTKWDISQAYIDAPYQISTVIMRGIYTNRIPPVVQRFGGDVVRTAPADYMGMFRWLNIPDPECNPDGTIGRWRAKFRCAPEPGDHDFGVSILHRRCDVQSAIVLCSEDEEAAGGEPVQAYIGSISAITDPASGSQITHDYTLATALPDNVDEGDVISVLRADGTTVIPATLTTITDTTHIVVTFAGAEDIDTNAPDKVIWDAFDQA